MFSASVAALAVTPTLQEKFLIGTWNNLSNKDKTSIQDALNCCGFNSGAQNNSANSGEDIHPTCKTEVLQASGVCILTGLNEPCTMNTTIVTSQA